MIKVVVVEPNKEPYLKEIETDLESLQTEVGGLIQITDVDNDISLVLNEEGKLIPLEFNMFICGHNLRGTFFVSGFDYDSEELVSLKENVIEELLKDIHYLDKIAIYIGGESMVYSEGNPDNLQKLDLACRSFATTK